MESEYARLATVSPGAGVFHHPGVPLSLRRRKSATNFAEFPSGSEEEGLVADYNTRSVISEVPRLAKDRLKKIARKGKKLTKKTHKQIPEPIKTHLTPPMTRYQCLEFLFIRLPILEWVWRYKFRQLIGDTVAGVVVGCAHIPEALGIAVLAGVPPILGLYTSTVPPLIYAVFGTSNYLSVGCYSLIAVTAGETVEIFASSTRALGQCVTDTIRNSTDQSSSVVSCESVSVSIVLTLSLLCGLFLLAMGILQLGFFNNLLSEAMLSGFTTGAAIATIISQMQFIFGFPQDAINLNSSVFFTPRQVVLFIDLLFQGQVEWASVIIGGIVIVFLILVNVANYFLRKKVKKIPLVIPGSLLALIVTTTISSAANLPAMFPLSVVGNTSTVFAGSTSAVGLPPFTGGQIDVNLLVDPDFVLNSFLLAVLIYVLSASHARVLAKTNQDIIHNHQELIAYGMCNAVGSLFGVIPTASNLSRALLQLSFGGTTQLAGIIAGLIVLLLSLFAAQLFAYLPLATLAAVICVGLYVLLLQFVDLKKFWTLSKWDLLTWIVTFLSVIILNIKIGLLIGFIMSLLIIVLRTVLPVSEALGVASEWDSATQQYQVVESIEGVLVYRFLAPLHFANVAVFQSRLQQIAQVQLSKKKGSIYGSDGCIPMFIRKCQGRREPESADGCCGCCSPPLPACCRSHCQCCSCCREPAAAREEEEEPREEEEGEVFSRLWQTSSPPDQPPPPPPPSDSDSPSPRPGLTSGYEEVDLPAGSLPSVNFESQPRPRNSGRLKNHQRKSYNVTSTADNRESLLLQRKEKSFEDVVLRQPLTESSEKMQSREPVLADSTHVLPCTALEGPAEPTVVIVNADADNFDPSVVVTQDDLTSGKCLDGSTSDGRESTLQSEQQSLDIDEDGQLDTTPGKRLREPDYVNVDTVKFRPKRCKSGHQTSPPEFRIVPTATDQRAPYQNVVPQRYHGHHDNQGDYYNVDRVKVEGVSRDASTLGHSRRSDLCQMEKLNTISVRHVIKRKLVHGEDVGDFDDFEELSTSFVRKLERTREHPYHTVVLDCGPISFIDSAGAQALHKLIKEFANVGIEFLLAGPSRYFIRSFERLGFCRRCSQHFIFPSIQSAVDYALSEQRQERPLSLLSEDHDEENPLSIGVVERHVVANRRLDFETSFAWLASGKQTQQVGRTREIPSINESYEDVVIRTV